MLRTTDLLTSLLTHRPPGWEALTMYLELMIGYGEFESQGGQAIRQAIHRSYVLFSGLHNERADNLVRVIQCGGLRPKTSSDWFHYVQQRPVKHLEPAN